MSVPDILVIGGGPAGYVAAIRAAQLNGRVTLVEKDRIGGTCLNRGCVPTKVLLERTEIATKLLKLGIVKSVEHPADFVRAMETKNLTVEKIVKTTGRLLDSYGIDVVNGFARIIGKDEIEISSQTGNRRVNVKNTIIASGSLPATLRIPGADAEGVLSGEEMLNLTEAPDRLLIVGGGGIGVEFACIFNAVGTKVTIVELMPQILPNEDAEMASYLREMLEKKGIEIQTAAKVGEIADHGSTGLSVRISLAGQEKTIGCDKVLLSVGRRPNTDGLGIENLNLILEKGWIKTDSHMRTSVSSVFAAGDAAGKYWLAYTASAEGVVAAENAMGLESEIRYSAIPRCTFSDPQFASVGLTENQARERGLNIRVGMFSFADNARALALGEEDGGAKVITDSDSGEILGVHIVGPEACELVNGMALAMKLEATIQDVGEMAFIHPTLFEVLKESALDANDKSIHRIKKMSP